MVRFSTRAVMATYLRTGRGEANLRLACLELKRTQADASRRRVVRGGIVFHIHSSFDLALAHFPGKR